MWRLLCQPLKCARCASTIESRSASVLKHWLPLCFRHVDLRLKTSAPSINNVANERIIQRTANSRWKGFRLDITLIAAMP
jgi:hypothetical protein